MLLDGPDRAILELMRKDARRTLADMGGRVGLSPSAVKRRIDRMQDAGVITGYTILIDHAKLGRDLEAFTELRFNGDARVHEIAGLGQELPEVQAVFTTAGDPDALVWIHVKDVNDLARVIDLIRRNPLVTGTKTLMVLDTWRPG